MRVRLSLIALASAWLLVACSSASPRYVGEHAPSPYDCGFGHVCERGEYCELDIPLNHDGCAPDGDCTTGHPSVHRCRTLPATCGRPLTCECLRAAQVPMSSCESQRLLGGQDSIVVSLERGSDGAILPLSCQELRCAPGSYCQQGEAAGCQPLPAACSTAASCAGCFPNMMCTQVGDQLRLVLPPPP